ASARAGPCCQAAEARRRTQAPSAIATARLDRRLMLLLAATTFAAAGGIHYQTPMLGAMAAEFGADSAAIGWIPTMSFGGFLARKSTRLNSSHLGISYAVFCLKKK